MTKYGFMKKCQNWHFRIGLKNPQREILFVVNASHYDTGSVIGEKAK